MRPFFFVSRNTYYDFLIIRYSLRFSSLLPRLTRLPHHPNAMIIDYSLLSFLFFSLPNAFSHIASSLTSTLFSPLRVLFPIFFLHNLLLPHLPALPRLPLRYRTFTDHRFIPSFLLYASAPSLSPLHLLLSDSTSALHLTARRPPLAFHLRRRQDRTPFLDHLKNAPTPSSSCFDNPFTQRSNPSENLRRPSPPRTTSSRTSTIRSTTPT